MLSTLSNMERMLASPLPASASFGYLGIAVARSWCPRPSDDTVLPIAWVSDGLFMTIILLLKYSM
jgi:hypothetical protein